MAQIRRDQLNLVNGVDPAAERRALLDDLERNYDMGEAQQHSHPQMERGLEYYLQGDPQPVERVPIVGPQAVEKLRRRHRGGR